MLFFLLVITIAIVFYTIKFIVFIIKQIVYYSSNKKAHQALSNAILSITDMSNNINIITFDEKDYLNLGIIIDERLAKICLFKRINNVVYKTVYKFYELASVQIVENNCQIVTDNSIDRALIGGALFGVAGAFVGGITAKDKVINKTTDIYLVLVFKNSAIPFYKFKYCKNKNGIDKTSNDYYILQAWFNRFNVIVENNCDSQKRYSISN
jgi:hypothetical protein